MIVADTNLIAYLVIEGRPTAAARIVLERDPEWAAPPIWRSEMRNLLATRMRAGLVTLTDAIGAQSAAEALVVGRELSVDSRRVLELALSSKCTAYDCEFIALAEDLRTVVVTSDRDMLRAFPDRAVDIESFTRLG